MAGCRNTFDNGESRAQDVVAHAEPQAVLDMQGGKIGANFQIGCDACPAITRGRGSADDVHSVAYKYSVRRITPIEGERLQGFADGWTRPCFKPEDITDELVDRFVEIHQAWAVINKPEPMSEEEFAEENGLDATSESFGEAYAAYLAEASKPPKPKSRDSVRKWLEKISSDECPDGPRYKAIGNSMSVNVMQWIGLRIQQQENKENNAQ